MGLAGISPVSQFLIARKDEAKAAADYVQSSQEDKRMVADFRAKAPHITTADQLMKDYSSNQVVLGAYNLRELMSQRALEAKLLTQDPASSTSLARSSAKASWLALADAFASMGAGKGTATATPFTSSMINKTITAYEQRQYENSSAMQKHGVGDALYFTRTMVSGKIQNLNDLMSDTTLLKVVEVVNGYDPDQFGALGFDQQKRILANRVDIKKLSDPKQVERYAEQYLAQLQVHPDFNKNDKPANMMDLFGGDDGEDGILALFGGSSGGDAVSEILSLF